MLAQRAASAGRKDWTWVVVSSQALLDSRTKQLLGLALAAGVLLLLVAASNISHLIAARAAQERKEVATRWALGANHARFLSWVTKRVLFVSLVSGLGAAVLATLALEVLAADPPEGLQFIATAELDLVSLIFGVTAAGATLLAITFLPQRFRSPEDLALDLRTDHRFQGPSGFGRALRGLHVVFLVASSVVLLVAAHLVIVSILKVARLDPGYGADGLQVLEVRIPLWKYREPSSRTELLERIRGHLSGLPGTSSMVLASHSPADASLLIGVVGLVGAPDNPSPVSMIGLVNVGPGYFQGLHQRVIFGRDVSADDVQLGAKVVAISEALARRLGVSPAEAVGRQVAFDGEPREVIGVVADVTNPGLPEELGKLQAYWPIGRVGGAAAFLIRAPEGAGAKAAAVAQGVDPDLVVRASSMRELLARSSATPRFLASVFSLLATLAATLAGLGVYGGLSSFASQRQPEIAVRMALGATRPAILKWLFRLGLAPVAVGVLLGTLLSFPFCRLLGEQLFGLAPDNLQARFTAGVVIAAIAMLAILPVALRASRLAPTEALR